MFIYYYFFFFKAIALWATPKIAYASIFAHRITCISSSMLLYSTAFDLSLGKTINMYSIVT